MNHFTASNGDKFKVGSAGGLDISGRWGSGVYLSPALVKSVREFFQAEADERLGRWRSTVDPGWTAVLDAGPQIIFFRHEDGIRAFDADPDGSGLSRWDPELQAVAREYLDAHPEPKPWHSVEVGDGWVLDTGMGDIVFSVVEVTYGGKPMRVFTRGTAFGRVEQLHVDDPQIKSGRRIFPEVSS